MYDDFDLTPPPEEATVTELSPDIFDSQEESVKWFDGLVNQDTIQSEHESQGTIDEIKNTVEAQASQVTDQESDRGIAEKIDLDVEASMEADYAGNLYELEDLVASLESDQAIDKHTAERIDLLTAGALSRRVPINSFTQQKSRTNLTVSMEVSDMARMAMYGVAGAALLGVGYILLKRQIEMASDPRNREATETIKNSSTLRNDRTEYAKDLRRITSHIQSGALRNQNLLRDLETNAKRRLSSINFTENDPNKFGEELVNGIWTVKIEKIWSPFMHAITNDSQMKGNINDLSAAYLEASEQFHNKLRDLKSRFKHAEELNYDDYRIDYTKFENLTSSFNIGSVTGRNAARKVNSALEKMTEFDPGLKVPSIDRVLTIYLDTATMNRLDTNAFNLATRINVLYTDMQLYATKYMESSPYKRNRLELLDELEKDMRTLGSSYASLINARNNARRLVTAARSAINEARGLWQAVDRDQTGKL